VISHEMPLTIIGVTDLDPDSMRGSARAPVYSAKVNRRHAPYAGL
jgi:hypothetical protein